MGREVGGTHPGTLECRTCWFWDKASADEGRCRRFPPRGYVWARVTPDDWCGEYQYRGGLTFA